MVSWHSSAATCVLSCPKTSSMQGAKAAQLEATSDPEEVEPALNTFLSKEMSAVVLELGASKTSRMERTCRREHTVLCSEILGKQCCWGLQRRLLCRRV
jgi:hypothetical protein